tara:strand:+ start:1892 stop:2992 length:1101 start_codon:yes stop_codon:yes gene_type:complete
MISKFKSINISILDTDRIGHMCLLDYYLAKKKNYNFKSIDIVGYNKKSENKYLIGLYKKKIILLSSYKLIFWLCYSLNFWFKKNNIVNKLDVNNIIYTKLTKKTFSISIDNDLYIKKLLEKFNLDPNKKYICIHNRDSTYLKKTYPEINFSYHDNRNFNISNMELAAKYFVNNNYNVIRLGSVTEESTNSPYIFDYPNTLFNSRKNDLYLLENLSFYFGSDSGIFNLAPLFRKSFSFVNFTTFNVLFKTYYWNNLPSIFKIMINSETKIPLTLNEIYKNNFDKLILKHHFTENNIELIDNSPQDILCLAKDVLSIYENKNLYKELDEILHFMDISKSYGRITNTLMPISNNLISNSFLKNNNFLLK